MEWLALLMAFIAGGLAATVAMLAVGWRGYTAEEEKLWAWGDPSPLAINPSDIPPRPAPPPKPPPKTREVVELHVKEM